jgi:hypothetical protein
MSILITLALTCMAIMAVLVLAACASFPNRSATDIAWPEGDWVGATGLPRPDGAKPAAGPRVHDMAARRPLKIHSWI